MFRRFGDFKKEVFQPVSRLSRTAHRDRADSVRRGDA